MKKQNIPAKKKAAPVNKTEATIKAYNRTVNYHIQRLSERGLSKEEIQNKLKDENARIMLCIAYDSYKLELGEVEKEVGKKKKKVKKNLVLYGVKALKHILLQKKVDMIDGGHNYVYVLTNKKDADKLADEIKEVCRVSIRKWEWKKCDVPREKKPTDNTDEKKIAAKKKRKGENMKKAAMRPYYAALRKGGISERIKKHNKALAAKIQEWLDKREKKAEEDVKNMKHKPKAIRKAVKKDKLAARKKARLIALQSFEKKRFEQHQAEKKKAAQKQGKQAQIEFKDAA